MRWMLAAIAFLSTSAWADHRDETHRSLLANRDAYGRVIHLFWRFDLAGMGPRNVPRRSIQ